MNPEHLLHEAIPAHACTGAECPQCSGVPTGRRSWTMVSPPSGSIVDDIVRCDGLRQTLTRIAESAVEYPESPGIPNVLDVISPEETARRAALLPTFRDSRGQAVSRWPDILSPSVTVVLFHQNALGMVYEILCHKRRDNGYFGLPGGKVEIGESLEEAAQRECLEETGYHVRVEQLTSVDSDPSRGALVAYPDGHLVQYVNCTFLCSIITGTLTISNESTVLNWYVIDALPQPFMELHAWRVRQAVRGWRREQIPVR